MANCPTDHPLCSGKYPVGLISGENPKFEPQVQGGHPVLGAHLDAVGLKHEATKGKYGGLSENSFIVHAPTREQMYDLGKKFGQEAVVYSDKGRHEMLYCNGENDLKFNPGQGHKHFKEAPSDYFTHIPGAGHVRLHFNFDKLYPSKIQRPEHNSLPERTEKSDLSEVLMGIASQLRKHTQPTAAAPWPHAYPWHDSSTHHHPRSVAFGIHLQKEEEVKPEDPKPAEAHFHQFSQPYGKITPGEKTDLNHYPYQGKLADVDRLLSDHQHTPYFVGGKYGRPDYATKNYDTKHLAIHDPTPKNGEGDKEYTEAWRKMHELSHALTLPEVNKLFGDGRRHGPLGSTTTPHEAERSVYWEFLSGMKQRELSRQIGVEIPDEVHNQEMNTLMLDSAHRAVTGNVTDPSAEGFTPHKHLVPLETALGLVHEHAQKMGLSTKKSETQSLSSETYNMADSYSIPEVQQILAKRIQDRIDSYTAEIVELRKRELAKGHVSKAEPLSKPSVSEAQNRAMHASASGHSTLGIPKSVGQDFVAADKGKKVGSLPEHKKGELEKVVPQNSPEEKKWREDNAKATAAGKKGIPVKPGDGIAKGEIDRERKAAHRATKPEHYVSQLDNGDRYCPGCDGKPKDNCPTKVMKPVTKNELTAKPTAESIRGASCPICHATEDACACISKSEQHCDWNKCKAKSVVRDGISHWCKEHAQLQFGRSGLPASAKLLPASLHSVDGGGKTTPPKTGHLKVVKSELEKMGISSMLNSNMANNNPNQSLTAQAPLALSEKSHDHLHNWVQDFADTNDKGDSRALKAYHRIKSGRPSEGDHERFHAWITDSADKDNSGDRKALEQWKSLRNHSMGMRKNGADAITGGNASGVTENLMSSEDPSYLRVEQGAAIPPKDSKSVARKPDMEKGAQLPGSAGKVEKADVPMAKPPSGKNPSAPPAMSKPKAPASAAAPKAPTAAPAPKAPGLGGLAKGGLVNSIIQGATHGAVSGQVAAHGASQGNPGFTAAGGIAGAVKGAIGAAVSHGKKKQAAAAPVPTPGSSAPQIPSVAKSELAKAVRAPSLKTALMHDRTQGPAAAAPAAPVKMPTQAEHADRAAQMQAHTPPGAFTQPQAPAVAPKPAAQTALHPALHVQAPSTPPPALPPGAGVSKPGAAPAPHQAVMAKVKGALGIH